MILMHGANSLARGDFVVIGGRKYKTVLMPDNKVWLAENLDFKFNGCDIGSSGIPSTPAAWYYDNDESIWGWNGRKCGLLYNWYAAEYLEQNKSVLLPAGWHVPSRNELFDLVNSVSNSNALKQQDGGVWPTGWNGTNEYGFGMLPAGWRRGDTGAFADQGYYCDIWSHASYDTATSFVFEFNPNGYDPNTDRGLKQNGGTIRLVKDAT